MKKTSPHSADISRFRSLVRAFFKKNGRRLPWRVGYDPYHIVVSEIMLQQTQVDRVALKFPPFITAFPDFTALATAPLARVLSFWKGLGYNRRALSLKKTADIIVRDYHGHLPDDPELLKRLPGIGPATAASICAFAFDKPVVFLETNIRTVLIHHFFPGRDGVTDRELLPVAAQVLDRKHPREWYSALMDYGTLLKKRHGNVSRRSAHHTTQTRFEGSRRQIRGRILSRLLERPDLTARRLSLLVNASVTVVTPIAETLVTERLLLRSGSRYRIA